MIKKTIILCAMSLVVAGCGQKKAAPNTQELDSRSMYFGGDFIYYADAALFRDCATGVSYNVEQNEAYSEVEKRYSSFGLPDKESVSLDVRGYLVAKDAGQEGHPYTLVITEMLDMDPELACDPESIVTGSYVMPGDTIVVAEDYTYTRNGVRGKWGMNDDREMVLMADADTMFVHVDLFEGDLIAGEQTRYLKQK